MTSQPAENEWVQVFQDRDVWNLTRRAAEKWLERNKTLFRLLREKVPHDGEVLELGCGPGRHAIAAALIGLRPTGIDLDPLIVAQASRNAKACGVDERVTFLVGDMNDLSHFADGGRFAAVTHGGVMEHFESDASVQNSLRLQLEVAPLVIFDVPTGSEKNQKLFARDHIFRQEWQPETWISSVLAPFNVDQWHLEVHDSPTMTDDLVVVLSR
jgi:cyclopropane fatty-acyl-phospholipid synthase-like methyltransferase